MIPTEGLIDKPDPNPNLRPLLLHEIIPTDSIQHIPKLPDKPHQSPNLLRYVIGGVVDKREPDYRIQ